MSLPSTVPESYKALDQLKYDKEEDQQAILELLDYYRHKVDVQEKERLEWLGEIE